MANYNVDIQVGIKGAAALDKFTKTIKELAEKTELVDKNFSKGIQNIARYERNLNKAARTLKLARTGQQQETIAIKNFVKALGEANTARERQQRLIKKEIATENAAKRVTSPGSTGFSSAQFGPALPPGMVKRLQFFKDRAVAERKFIELTEAGNRAARQRTAEFLRQQRILKAGGNQFPGGVGPQQAPLQGPQQAPGFQGVAAKRVEAQVRRNAQVSIEAAKKVSQIELALDRKLEMAGLEREMNIFKNKEKLAVQSFKNEKRRNKQQVADFDKRLRQSTAAKSSARKQSNQAASNLALGIGFPLLFGGGAGSVAGGALGSVGGMGGQVLGSAIGGIIDQTVANIAKLGQALNPLTADIGAVTAAAGESGTAFEQLTRELEEAVGKEKALAVATEQLATIIGQDGVDALQEFGEETTLLGNEVSQALSIISSALAEFVNRTGLLAKLISNIDESTLFKAAKRNTTDPELNRLKAERKNITPATAKTTSSFLGVTISSDLEDQLDANRQLIVSRQRELEIERQLEIVNGANAVINRKKASLTEAELAVLEAERKVIISGNSLLEEKAYQAARSVVFANTALAVRKAENDTSKIALIAKNRDNQLEELKARRARQATAKAKSTARLGVATGRKDQRDADRAEKERLRSLKSGEKLILGLEKQLAINSSSFKFTKEFAAADFEREALQLRINDLLDEEQRKTAAILADRQAAMAGAGIFADMGDPSEMIGFDQAVVAGQTLQLLEQEEALQRILEKYPMIGEAATAAAGLVTFGVQEMIDGTKSAEQVFADFLNSIADMLMKTAQQMIATYIATGIARMFAMGGGMSFSDFSGSMSGGNPFTPGGSMPFLTGYADGGRPPVGRPSIVGERGPELFVPGASGTIIPNHAMGGANVTVNVDASGSSVEGDSDQASQLGKMLGSAVQAELIKQKRPGGLLAS